MSRQKKQSIKRKETAAGAIARAHATGNDEEPSTSTPKVSRTTLYRRKMQARQHMPESPVQYASVVQHLVQAATPRKEVELNKRGLKRKLEDTYMYDELEESIRSAVVGLKTKMTEGKRQKYNLIAYACQQMKKYDIKDRVAASLGIGGKTRRRARKQTLCTGRKKRKDSLNQITVYAVEDFWKSADVSGIMPLKEQVRKGEPAYLLECNYTQAYTKFRKLHPAVKIGFVKFVALKPKCIRSMKAMERIVCCCKPRENTRLKLEALNRQVRTEGKSNLCITSIESLSDKTICLSKSPMP